MPESIDTWPRNALAHGTALHGYAIEAILGSGGFGITYRARDKIDQIVAIKECFPRQFAVRHGLEVQAAGANDLVALADCLDRFLREAKALARLSRMGAASDGVVKVVTFFEANSTAYLVMEYLAGPSLERLIAANPTGLDAAVIASLLRGLLNALASVHRAGLLHRDIKPGNVILREDGRPVLIDFGAIRAADIGHADYTQIYSRRYAPIEQFDGDKQGPFSDIYALGMTCYYAIGGTAMDAGGREPIDARWRMRALRAGRPDPLPGAARIGAGRYPPRLLAAIDAALAVAPDQRPQSVVEVLAQLDGDDRATIVVPPAGPQPAGEPAAVDGGERPHSPKRSEPGRPSARAAVSPTSRPDETTLLLPRRARRPRRALVAVAVIVAAAVPSLGTILILRQDRERLAVTGNPLAPERSTSGSPSDSSPGNASPRSDAASATGRIPEPRPAQQPPADKLPLQPIPPPPVTGPAEESRSNAQPAPPASDKPAVEPPPSPGPRPNDAVPSSPGRPSSDRANAAQIKPVRPLARPPKEDLAVSPPPRPAQLPPETTKPATAPAPAPVFPNPTLPPGQVRCIMPADDHDRHPHEVVTTVAGCRAVPGGSILPP
jgi:serine/threonine protein kinase